MKKTVLLGLVSVAAAATAFGQGGIVFNNSLPDAATGNYNPITFASGGAGVSSTDGIMVNFWYGKGAGLSADQLTTMGPAVNWNMAFENAGYFGFYTGTEVDLQDWTAGDTYTFQLRATGPNVDQSLSRSVTWDESGNIKFIGGIPPGLPGTSANHIGFEVVAVPEPTTLALLGLGAAGLLFARRRS